MREFANWLEIPHQNLDTLLLSIADDFSDQVLAENWRGEVEKSYSTTDLSVNTQELLIDDDFSNIGKGL